MFGGPSGKLPSVNSGHNFSQIPQARIQRSAFDRSCKHMTTFQAGFLVPFFVDEVLPGDTFSLNSTIFARLLTSLVPAMDNLQLSTQFFFVPNRLVWTNWEKFCGAQTNPGDSISFLIPQMGPHYTSAPMTISDYFGLPVNVELGGTAGNLSALPFRAYNLIWNQWYRDENIQNSVATNTGDGPDSIADYTLLQRGKRKDYFYGALPFTQKGTAVSYLTGTVPVYGDGANPLGLQNVTQPTLYGQLQLNTGTVRHADIAPTGGAWTSTDSANISKKGGAQASNVYADLSSDTSNLINTLRQAFQIQKFMERDARGGTRYTELILSHFGVTNPDFRLQRPEYLGGGTCDINSTPIPQTTPTGIAGTTTKFGDLAAFSTALGTRNGFTKSFTEHGHIIGLMSVSAKLSYQQGLNKMWIRNTRYDFYWPVFAHLGEQAISGAEIYYLGDKAGANTDAGVWGYQERYAEYRYKPSQISGLFRSTVAAPLDQWHYAQNYASRPALNSTYLPDDTATNLDRNLGVTHSATVAQFKADIYHNLKCARPMPVFGVPGDIDRF